MKITDIKVYLLQRELTSSMQISRGGFSVRNHTIVEVHTDAGVSGLGEGIGNARLIKSILEGQMVEWVAGMDPFNIELLRKRLLDDQVYYERKGSALCAASAIEMACWDIKGKALNVPVYELLGGLYRQKIRAYASDIYWEESVETMARNAERIAELGFKAIKAHIGYGSPESDFNRIKAIREAIGDDIELMIDLNCGYDFMQANRAVQLWEECNLKWLEEPLNPNHAERMAELRTRTMIPLAFGENEFRTYGFKDIFDKKSVDVAMPDIGRVGGIQETKNICALADAYGIAVSPHNYSSGILLAATMHLMASSPNTDLLEIDTSENAIIDELLLNPLDYKDGMVTVPDTPGLGVVLDLDIIGRYLAH